MFFHVSMVKLLVTRRARTHANFLATNIITLSFIMLVFSNIYTGTSHCVVFHFIPISIIRYLFHICEFYTVIFLHSAKSLGGCHTLTDRRRKENSQVTQISKFELLVLLFSIRTFYKAVDRKMNSCFLLLLDYLYFLMGEGS